MTPIAIQILELVRAQPAHKLPLVFTIESNPIPDCDETPEGVLEEALRLERDHLVEAFVVRSVTGKPRRVEIKYITLSGRVAMDGRDAKIKEGGSLGKVILLMLALICFGGLLFFFLRPNPGNFSSGKSISGKSIGTNDTTGSPVNPPSEPIQQQPNMDSNSFQAEPVHGEQDMNH